MTEIEENIICQFKELVLKHEIPLVEQEIVRGGSQYFYYSVLSNPIVIKFIADLSGVNLSFINQYIFVNNFLALINGNEKLDVYINLVNDMNGLSFDFSLFNIFDHDYNFFLTLDLPHDKQTSLSYLQFRTISTYTRINNPDDYELAYNDVLSAITTALDPNIQTFKQILEISKISNVDFVNNRLLNTDLKLLSVEEFIYRYSVDDSSVFMNNMSLGSHTVTVDSRIFQSFLNENFSPFFAHKLKTIVTLSSFQEQFFKRNINWHYPVANYFSVCFSKISKYSNLNQVYSFFFGSDLNFDGRETMLLYDDGTIEFYDSTTRTILTDLDSIYERLKENFILKMESDLQMNRNDIRLQNLKVYEMLIL